MTSSKIVINCSTNFSSLRIEDKRKSPGVDLGKIQSSQVTVPSNVASLSKNEIAGQNTAAFLCENVPDLSKHFILDGIVGQGTFGRVFKAKLKKNEKKEYALKYVFPTVEQSKIAAELRFLRDIGGSNNVCGVESAIIGKGNIIFVLPYFPHDKLVDYLPKMTIADIQDYIKNLLLALKQVHSHKVIHRDLKPTNFLYNYQLKKYMLVDFGLAQSEKDYDLQRKKTIYLQRGKIMASKSLDNHESSNREPLASKKATINQLVSAKPELHKQFMIRKRPYNGESSARPLSKKLKNEEYPKEAEKINEKSSVFNTPDTPNTTMVKSPLKGSKVDDPGNSLFKTPTKRLTRKQASKTAEVTIIPETPLKTVVANTIGAPPIMPAPTVNVLSSSTTPKSRLQDTTKLKCDCLKKPQICLICDSERKLDMHAPRWGTPGFRAPEVLLKSLDQTTAVDLWSAGVIFASLLSRRYPFFRNDDMDSLAEIATFLGYKRLQLAATKMGRWITISKGDAARLQPPNIKLLLSCLRNGTNNLSVNSENHELIPDSAIDLLDRLLEPCPDMRITAKDALLHPFIKDPIPLVEISVPSTPESSNFN